MVGELKYYPLPPSTEVRSTFNLWSTLLAETRKMSRERATMAEVMASEMVARLEIMTRDVHTLSKKVCVGCNARSLLSSASPVRIQQSQDTGWV